MTDQPNTPPPETPHRSDHDASWPEAETATEASTTPRPTTDAPAESTTATAPAAEKPDNTSVATKKRHRLRTPPTGSTNHPTPTETNPSGKRQGNRPCKAHTSSGRCCRNAAIKGGTVCPMHGGSAPQVIASAKQRLLEAAEPAVRTLRKAIGAVDKDRQPSAVAVRAAEAILDRAGLPAKHVVEGGLDLTVTDEARSKLRAAFPMYEPEAPVVARRRGAGKATPS